MTAGKIVVVDDDADIGELVAAAAQIFDLPCTVTTNADAFLLALTEDTSLIFLDLMMPDTDGIELLRLLGSQRCRIAIVLMSGIGLRVIETAEELAKALGLHIVAHLEKPFRLADLEALLRKNQGDRQPARPAIRPAADFSDEALTGAFERQEFVVHYQPQIEITSMRVTGLEGLVRWQSPGQSLIYPDHFISRLEYLKLIDELAWVVVNRGLADLHQFGDELGELPTLSVNVSAMSLRDLKVPEKLMFLLNRHGVAPAKLTLEITESGLIDELTSTLAVIARLRMKGMGLSIDDFGTGYSMMRQLKRLPATELKVDRSFIQNMHAGPRDRVMVLKTIEIGRELGMKVVAEGVETKEQLDFLRENKCDTAQGYYFSRPLPMNELIVWLRKFRAQDATPS